MVTDASLIIANASLDSMQPRENSDPHFRNLKTLDQNIFNKFEQHLNNSTLKH